MASKPSCFALVSKILRLQLKNVRTDGLRVVSPTYH